MPLSILKSTLFLNFVTKLFFWGFRSGFRFPDNIILYSAVLIRAAQWGRGGRNYVKLLNYGNTFAFAAQPSVLY